MGGLKKRLDAIRAGFAKQVPVEVKEVMDRATDDLRESGIISSIPKVGNTLEPFELADADGTMVSSADLLETGPLVVTLYRGVW